MKRVRIATRASELALAQARIVAGWVEAQLGVATELLPIKTRGDRLRETSLATLGGKGLFVGEIEEALLEGRADLAVHSAKDLPGAIAPGLEFAALPKRGDPRDALLSRVRGADLIMHFLQRLSPFLRILLRVIAKSDYPARITAGYISIFLILGYGIYFVMKNVIL